VWQYNENFTHTLYLKNNTWRNNKQFGFVVDGHFAQLNLTHNVFEDNQCKSGLISIRGMEKRMRIAYNRVLRNAGIYMVEFRADSQSEILGEVDARFYENEVKENRFNVGLNRGFHQVRLIRLVWEKHSRLLFGRYPNNTTKWTTTTPFQILTSSFMIFTSHAVLYKVFSQTSITA
jgi:hypothetical protein